MKKNLICLALLSLGLSSCKDFLTVVPETERTTANFYKTAADFNTAVVGTYSTFKHPGLYGNGAGALIWLGEVSTDNTDYGFPRTVASAGAFEIEDLNFSLANIYFRDAWLGHYQGIGRANGILDQLPDVSFDATLKNQYEGEARFLRAMYYFNLVRLFGPVQLITTQVNDPYGTANVGRAPVGEVYALIENDLKAAEGQLPATITAANAGRASRWAAKALLGKVYLTQKKYDLASAKLKEIVDANVHSLMPNYADAFSLATSFANNREVMLAVQYKGGQIGQGGSFYSQWTPFSALSPDFGVTGGAGDGLNRPTPNLIAAYATGDARRAASIALSYTSTTGVVVNEPYPVKFRQTGIIRGESDVDFPVLRYADVLLMYAEALNELGQPAAAPLNLVRTRARLANTTAATQPALRLALEQERRVELAFESQRWFDLVRTNRFEDVMRAHGKPVQPFQVLYPLPQRETDLNKNLAQNPGY
ncbi:RagB/SusD family nutrient uptake outer membrane protein [Hymenobacter arizonensis]|uniref:Starch-binding associating with outer membrane n=1 Tax=Hymenobacter arizonensis TaxID=1227077 RepID=A0A1I6BJD9_HYMAR|nr:RagB/SusD family nutrient uptake outer membrane protein [Hymenobacter arizonensis]SFQ81050.1 Starch-binding associating with outer membrane [Hymenobacter arizonensis]